MVRLTTRVAAAAAALAALAGAASAHEIRGRVSAAGVEFLEQQLPSYVPRTLEPPEFGGGFLCVDAAQRDTVVQLEVHDADLSIPQDSVLAIDLELTAVADGELFLDDPYACLGEATCTDHLELHHARARMEFQVAVTDGEPRVLISDVQLMVGEDDVVVDISDCAIDEVLEGAVDFAREWLLGYLLDFAEGLAAEKIAPLLEELIGGFTRFEGSVSAAEYAVSLEELAVRSDGIDVGADGDLTSSAAPASCIGEDPGEPQSHAGAAPTLGNLDTHLALAVNLGLVDDALYHVWRSGLTCVTGDSLEELDLHLDLDHITGILPGFPAGTEFDIAARLTAPPRVLGRMNEDLEITVLLEGAEIELTGHFPDGRQKSLRIFLDAEATGVVGLNPAVNALALTLTSVDIQSLEMEEDQLDAHSVGFDVARLHQVLEEAILPELLAEMGEVPLTGSVFGFEDYAILLRDLRTSEAYLTVEADLFRAPAVDETAPDTSILEHPGRVVRPEEAVLRVGGTDAEIPSELLQYEVAVDGAVQPLTYLREIHIGEVGETATYQVQVAAVDLHGNTDPTPAEVEVTVDGVAPRVALAGKRVERLPGPGSVEVVWSASDDRTPAEALELRAEVYHLLDPKDPLEAELVETLDLPSGETRTEVELPSTGTYRIEVHAVDEAGNDALSSMLVEVKGGGCRLAGRGAKLPAALGLLGALALLRRRRYRLRR